MLFRCDDATRFNCRRQHGLVVQWTDRGHIEDTRLNAPGGKHLGRLERPRNQHAVGDQGDIAAVAQERGLPDLEVIVGVVHNGHG